MRNKEQNKFLIQFNIKLLELIQIVMEWK